MELILIGFVKHELVRGSCSGTLFILLLMILYDEPWWSVAEAFLDCLFLVSASVRLLRVSALVVVPHLHLPFTPPL